MEDRRADPAARVPRCKETNDRMRGEPFLLHEEILSMVYFEDQKMPRDLSLVRLQRGRCRVTFWSCESTLSSVRSSSDSMFTPNSRFEEVGPKLAHQRWIPGSGLRQAHSF